MASNPPPDYVPQEPQEPQQQEPSRWEILEQRGFDPSRYDPDAVVNGANLYTALRSRDYRDGAISDILRNAGFPEDLSVQELRELAMQRQQPDPWEQFGGQQEEEYYDPQPQQPAFDPNALRSAIDAEIERRFAERDQRMEEQRRQEAYEQEFAHHVDRVAKANDFDSQEVVWLAAEANMLRSQMPYATTQQVLDEAGNRMNARLNARLQALSQRQEAAPAAPMPAGPNPSDQQVPQSAEEARQAARRFFTN